MNGLCIYIYCLANSIRMLISVLERKMNQFVNENFNIMTDDIILQPLMIFFTYCSIITFTSFVLMNKVLCRNKYSALIKYSLGIQEL